MSVSIEEQQSAAPREVEGVSSAPTSHPFDGVICFGGSDWWYHNRGHYDLQMMRQFSRQVPVVYVNSIGIRMPKLGERSMFFRRVGRKLKSLRRGFVRISDNFAVLSPVAIPGNIGVALSGKLLKFQIGRASRRMRIRRPLIWVECPTAARALNVLDPVGIVYQRTDRYENFPDADTTAIRKCDLRLKEQADLTLFCSRLLYADEAGSCRMARYVDHGVDYAQFAQAGALPSSEPMDLRGIARPRIGFVGGIDSHTFDSTLFLQVASQLPECQFVLVGSCSLPAGWCNLPNVVLLGQRPYDSVAAYMAACDVLIMPWNRNEWIKACNPVKLKEYLAVGRPVVSTYFSELRHYEGLVRCADDAAGFAEQIQEALREEPDVHRMRQRVISETWEAKAKCVLSALESIGVTIA